MKDALVRAAWTAAEAFLAVVLPALSSDIFDGTKVKAVAIAALVAAIAAALTVIKEAVKAKIAPKA